MKVPVSASLTALPSDLLDLIVLARTLPLRAALTEHRFGLMSTFGVDEFVDPQLTHIDVRARNFSAFGSLPDDVLCDTNVGVGNACPEAIFALGETAC